MIQSSLSIHGLHVMARIGCSEEEQAQAQELLIDIQLEFALPPPGCESDRLNDTICYDEVMSLVTRVASSQPFALVEKLGYELFQSIKSQIGQDEARLRLRLKKLHPPVSHRLQNVEFEIQDPAFS